MIRFSIWFVSWMFALCAALFFMFYPSHAHATTPSCFPGDPTASSSLPTISYDANTCAAVWFCDEGTGAWVKYYVAGSGLECTTAPATALAVLALTHDQKVALWNTTFTVSLTPADAAAMPGKPLVDAIPTPSAPPASGLTSKETKVYKLNTHINAAPTFSLVGATKLGTPCDVSVKVGSLYRIDRALVTFPKGVIQPPATFAKCD